MIMADFRLVNHSEVTSSDVTGYFDQTHHLLAVIVEAAAVDPEACVQSFLENLQRVGSGKPRCQVNAVYASWSIRKLMQCVGRCTRNGGKVWVILGLCGTWSQLVVG